jgi:Sigma-54 interaction domain
MENRSNAVATAARRTIPASPPLIKKERRIVRPAPRRDLQVGSMPRTNVLVIGNPEATRIVVDMLRLDLRGPIARWRAGQPLDLPSPAHAATLVLENVSRLTPDEQFCVLRWLDDVRGRIRVVSTTNEPLWPRVQVGVFNEVLYYRLNTIFVDMGTV